MVRPASYQGMALAVPQWYGKELGFSPWPMKEGLADALGTRG